MQELNIEWDAFKLIGDIESHFGDIAIIVRTSLGSGKILEGVGFIEAKRISPATKEFDGITRWEQLELMLHNAPHHCTLLFDVGRVPVQANGGYPPIWIETIGQNLSGRATEFGR
jgi:hypothetical protein